MTNEINQKPDQNQTDRILSAVEKMVNEKIESDIRCHRETNSVHAKSALGGYLAVAITLGVGAGGIVADTYLKNRDRDDQVLREASQRKLAVISQISGAVTSMRELKDLTLVSCKKGITGEEKHKLMEDRIKTGYELVKAARPMLHFFNDKFRELVKEFLSWEDSIKDYCDPSAPSEAEWVSKQKELEQQMVIAPIEHFIDAQF